MGALFDLVGGNLAVGENLDAETERRKKYHREKATDERAARQAYLKAGGVASDLAAAEEADLKAERDKLLAESAPPDPMEQYLQDYRKATARMLSVGTTRASSFKQKKGAAF